MTPPNGLDPRSTSLFVAAGILTFLSIAGFTHAFMAPSSKEVAFARRSQPEVKELTRV